MRARLSNPVKIEMWYFDRKLAELWPVNVISESLSGATIQTSDNKLIRTNTKNHAVFFSRKIAEAERLVVLEKNARIA